MKITRVSVYSIWLPYVGGEYRWGPGRVLTGGTSIVVVVDTDAGVSGCGEVCPIGANYLAAHAQGVLAAQSLLAHAVPLAASTPPEPLYNTTDLYHYNTRSTGTPGPAVADGCPVASLAPGLGVEAALGEPVAVNQ